LSSTRERDEEDEVDGGDDEEETEGDVGGGKLPTKEGEEGDSDEEVVSGDGEERAKTRHSLAASLSMSLDGFSDEEDDDDDDDDTEEDGEGDDDETSECVESEAGSVDPRRRVLARAGLLRYLKRLTAAFGGGGDFDETEARPPCLSLADLADPDCLSDEDLRGDAVGMSGEEVVRFRAAVLALLQSPPPPIPPQTTE